MCRWLWRCKRNIFLDFLFIISWGSSGSSKMCSWVTLEDNGVDCVAIEMQWLTLSQKLETDTDYVPDFSLVPSLLLDYRKRGIQLLSVRIIKTMGSVVFAFFFFCHTAPACRFPDQGSNLCPLQWEGEVLTTVLPGKSLGSVVEKGNTSKFGVKEYYFAWK